MADDGSLIGELRKRAREGDEGHEGQKEKAMKADRIMVLDAAASSRLPVVVQLRGAIELQEEKIRDKAWSSSRQNFFSMLCRLQKLRGLLERHVAASSSAMSSTAPPICLGDRA